MMNYVQHYEINGISTKQIACIELHGEPNAATEGAVGVLAIDMDSPNHDLYKCVAANNGIYTWELHSGTGGGGGSVEVEVEVYDSLDALPDDAQDGDMAIIPGGELPGGSGDGGELPTPTEADNGKFVVVADGEYALANLPIYIGEYEVVE